MTTEEFPDAAMKATAPEDDDPRSLTGDLVPDDDLQFEDDVTVDDADVLLDEA